MDSIDCSTIVELLQYRAAHQPDEVAYIFLGDGETESDRASYGQLARDARTVAASLRTLVSPGDRVLLLFPSSLKFASAFLGCLWAGAIAVPAYPPRRNQRLERLLAIARDAEPSLILTATDLLEAVRAQFQESQWSQVPCQAIETLLDRPASENLPVPIDPDTLAFLQYTSGSTGDPKGVMVSHRNIMHNQQLIRAAFEHSEASSVVGWLPLFHDMGLIGNLLQPLYLGILCTLMPPAIFLQKPIRWLQAIARYRATTSGGPNFAYDLCVQKVKPEQLEAIDLSSWDLAFTGAEPIRSPTLERFAEYFAPCGFRREAFYPCYGMAETTLIVSGGLKSEPPIVRAFESSALEQNEAVAASADTSSLRKLVGCGAPLKGFHVAIVHPETGEQLPEGRVGEIWASGDSIARGYWNKPVQTEKSFHARVSGSDGSAYLRTGDLGFLSDGELFVTGRLKDVIIIRGQNHYPQDIELTVEHSHPALRANAGAVFTVERGNGENLVVVQEVDRTHLRNLDAADAIGCIRQAIAADHGLTAAAVALLKTGSILKTSSGKIRRRACREAFSKGELNVVGAWQTRALDA